MKSNEAVLIEVIKVKDRYCLGFYSQQKKPKWFGIASHQSEAMAFQIATNLKNSLAEDKQSAHTIKLHQLLATAKEAKIVFSASIAENSEVFKLQIDIQSSQNLMSGEAKKLDKAVKLITRTVFFDLLNSYPQKLSSFYHLFKMPAKNIGKLLGIDNGGCQGFAPDGGIILTFTKVSLI